MKKARLGEWNLQQGRLSSFQDFSPENDEKLSIKRGKLRSQYVAKTLLYSV